jgi:phage gp29-like protein
MEKTNNPAGFSAQLATRERTCFVFYGMYLPNPDLVLRAIGRNIDIYHEIQINPYVRGAVKNRRAGVLSLDWQIDRGKAPSRHADSIEKLFRDINIQSLISELLWATQFGYQPAEIMWGKVGNFIMPDQIVGKPPEWFLFGNDDELRLRTIENFAYGMPVPEKKFLLARQESTYQNPYGVADSSACFWPVSFMKGDLTFWVRFLEKFGMAKIIGKHPRGTDPVEVDEQIDKLDKLVQDGVASIPDDSSVEILEDKGKNASSSAYRDLLNECKNEISVVQLGHEAGFQSTPGKLGRGKMANEVRQDIIDADKKIIESVFNEQLIPWIWDMNFDGTGDRPVFSMYSENAINYQSNSSRDVNLSQIEVKFKKEYYMGNYGMKVDEFEVGPVSATPGAVAKSKKY